MASLCHPACRIATMSIRRIALIFDDRIRPGTTRAYCPQPLAEVVEMAHFHPDQRGQFPSTRFDRYLSIDDDTHHRLPGKLDPGAYSAIDTHLDFAARGQRARPCEVIFAAQRDAGDRLRAARIESVAWLPLACDPAVHRKRACPSRTRSGSAGTSGSGKKSGPDVVICFSQKKTRVRLIARPVLQEMNGESQCQPFVFYSPEPVSSGDFDHEL